MIKNHEKNILLELNVSPNKCRFCFDGFDKWTNRLRVKITNQPEKGKANKELIRELEKFFNTKVEIIKGQKSRYKTVLVHVSPENAREKLETL